MKYDREKVIELITDYINYDMQSKDRYGEINWLLKEAYKKDEISQIVEDWNLEDEEQWGEENINKIKQEEEK